MNGKTTRVFLQPTVMPRFGATVVGRMTLKDEHRKPAPVKIIRLQPDEPDDIDFLGHVVDVSQGTVKGCYSLVPKREGIDYQNHQELAQEVFENSFALLVAARDGKLTQAPIVLLALDDSNIKKKKGRLLGIRLGHIERHLADGYNLYTPLPLDIENDKTKGLEANHSSLNWMVSLTRLRCIGKALLAAQEKLLPPSIKRVDVVAEMSKYCQAVIPLFKKFGFEALPQLLDAKPIPWNPKPESQRRTFREIHGLPMSADRAVFHQKAEQVRKALGFQEPRYLEQLTGFNPFEQAAVHVYVVDESLDKQEIC